MGEFSAKTDKELADMGQASFELSKQFTPELWADRLLSGLNRLPD